MKRLSHLDRNGRAVMVDVSAKRPTRRRAVVRGMVRLSPDAFALMQRHRLAKGDPCTVAQIAGLQAAKRTAELIPLCHPLPIEHLDLRLTPEAATRAVRIEAVATTTAKTGIEMEAFTAAAVAALTLYDMVKAVDPGATITDLQLVSKTGGKQAFERERA